MGSSPVTQQTPSAQSRYKMGKSHCQRHKPRRDHKDCISFAGLHSEMTWCPRRNPQKVQFQRRKIFCRRWVAKKARQSFLKLNARDCHYSRWFVKPPAHLIPEIRKMNHQTALLAPPAALTHNNAGAGGRYRPAAFAA